MKSAIGPSSSISCFTQAVVLSALSVNHVWAQVNTAGLQLSAEPKNRYTDYVIKQDWQAIDSLQAKLHEVQPRMDSYAAYKAQYLIDWLISEYNENDRSAVTNWVFNAVKSIVVADSPDTQRAIALSINLNKMQTVRSPFSVYHSGDDSYLKQVTSQPTNISCAPQALAKYDVALSVLGHYAWEKLAYKNQDLQLATQQRKVIDSKEQLNKLLSRCEIKTEPKVLLKVNAPAALVKPPTEVPAPARVAVSLQPAMPNVSEKLNELGVLRVHFHSNTVDKKNIIVPDKNALAWYIAQLGSGKPAVRYYHSDSASNNTSVEKLRVVGYADALGNAKHNVLLSKNRAETVSSIIEKQTTNVLITHTGLGDSNPISVGCCKPAVDCRQKKKTPQSERCLAVDRRVEVSLFAGELRQAKASRYYRGDQN